MPCIVCVQSRNDADMEANNETLEKRVEHLYWNGDEVAMLDGQTAK